MAWKWLITGAGGRGDNCYVEVRGIWGIVKGRILNLNVAYNIQHASQKTIRKKTHST